MEYVLRRCKIKKLKGGFNGNAEKLEEALEISIATAVTATFAFASTEKFVIKCNRRRG
ncbi:MAG: hypothetical protein R2837_04925 [Aliarcobacter sp.]